MQGVFLAWSFRSDSNTQLSPSEGGALSVELLKHSIFSTVLFSLYF